MADGVVLSLQVQPALQSLAVGDPCLGLDSSARRHRHAPLDLAVPSPKAALDAERNLRAPSQGRVKSGPESVEQRQLSAVANRIAGWVGSDREIKTHDRTPRPQLAHRYAVEFPLLETQELLMRGTRCRADLAKTQSGTDSREPMVLPDAAQGFASASAPSIGRSLAGSHRRHDPRRRFTAYLSAGGPLIGARGEHEAGWGTVGPLYPLPGPVGGPFSGQGPRIGLRPAGSIDPTARWSASRTKRVFAWVSGVSP